ncbi:MAG: PfkB family carbohydrate kinase [Acidimicrobiales bacterium]
MSEHPERVSHPVASPSVAVLAPAPLLTITIEAGAEQEEVHLHPGGQGVWIARLLASLDIDVVLCASFGGESGSVVQALVAQWDFDLRAVQAAGANGVYVHDRRSGTRLPIAETDAARRTRHEVDELYGTAVVAGIHAGTVVLGGPETSAMARGDVPELIPTEAYTRLARDLRANSVTVVADLSGPTLDAAVRGGLDLVKVSDEDLLACGDVEETSVDALLAAARRLASDGAEAVVVTRAERPALVLIDGTPHEIHTPHLDPVDPRGAGDSFTAGMVSALARGSSLADAVRLGSAAGTLNVARRGMGSGSRREIELFAHHVTITEMDR